LTHEQLNIWTIGHSTRAIGDFIELLSSNGIEALADVRRFPASRRHPHFNRDALSRSLATASIEYVSLPELGGRRQARPDSPNILWQNKSFRGYADYMESELFRAGIERLIIIARNQRLAVMCAEAVWWRCHRALIADHLKALGINVIHINPPGKNIVHPYTSAARIIDGKLSYAGLLSNIEED
jgi:uncharacterized protein (DUF488 family)